MGLLRSFSQTVNLVKASVSQRQKPLPMSTTRRDFNNLHLSICLNMFKKVYMYLVDSDQCFAFRSQSELFPSKIRVSALSVSGTCGRVGALLAPAIIEECPSARKPQAKRRPFTLQCEKDTKGSCGFLSRGLTNQVHGLKSLFGSLRRLTRVAYVSGDPRRTEQPG